MIAKGRITTLLLRARDFILNLRAAPPHSHSHVLWREWTASRHVSEANDIFLCASALPAGRMNMCVYFGILAFVYSSWFRFTSIAAGQGESPYSPIGVIFWAGIPFALHLSVCCLIATAIPLLFLRSQTWGAWLGGKTRSGFVQFLVDEGINVWPFLGLMWLFLLPIGYVAAPAGEHVHHVVSPNVELVFRIAGVATGAVLGRSFGPLRGLAALALFLAPAAVGHTLANGSYRSPGCCPVGPVAVYAGWAGLAVLGFGLSKFRTQSEPQVWKHPPFLWPRSRPHPLTVEAALHHAVGVSNSPASINPVAVVERIARVIDKLREPSNNQESVGKLSIQQEIAAAMPPRPPNPRWETTFVATNKLVSKGGEALLQLRDGTKQRDASCSTTWDWIVNSICGDTRRLLSSRYRFRVCPVHLTACRIHWVSPDRGLTSHFYGCSRCGRSTGLLNADQGIIAVVTSETRAPYHQEDGTLFVNWAISPSGFDFNGVEFRQVDDKTVERFLIDVSNNWNEEQRRIARKSRVVIRGCDLSQNTLRQLAAFFSVAQMT